MQVKMRRRFRKGIELTERQFSEQHWIYGTLTLRENSLYLKDGPVSSNPAPFGVLYRPTLKAVFSGTISFSGIELDGKAWCAQVWYCETFNTTPPVGAIKNADGTLRSMPAQQQ